MHDIRGKCVIFGRRRPNRPSDILNQRLMERNRSLLRIDREMTIFPNKEVHVSLIDVKCLNDCITCVDGEFIFTQKIKIDYKIKLEDELDE